MLIRSILPDIICMVDLGVSIPIHPSDPVPINISRHPSCLIYISSDIHSLIGPYCPINISRHPSCLIYISSDIPSLIGPYCPINIPRLVDISSTVDVSCLVNYLVDSFLSCIGYIDIVVDGIIILMLIILRTFRSRIYISGRFARFGIVVCVPYDGCAFIRASRTVCDRGINVFAVHIGTRSLANVVRHMDDRSSASYASDSIWAVHGR